MPFLKLNKHIQDEDSNKSTKEIFVTMIDQVLMFFPIEGTKNCIGNFLCDSTLLLLT